MARFYRVSGTNAKDFDAPKLSAQRVYLAVTAQLTEARWPFLPEVVKGSGVWLAGRIEPPPPGC